MTAPPHQGDPLADRETVNDSSQGVQLATTRELARYWANDHDWRKVEARLNALPQFVTQIDGVDIHFIHVRSKHADALPVIITHGWPGSVIEQLKVVGPLTDPHGARRDGGGRLPRGDPLACRATGFPASRPWAAGTPIRIAKAWAVLMPRLGYKRYVAQGGLLGQRGHRATGPADPAGLVGIHTNMPATVPNDINAQALANAPPPSGLSADELSAYKQLAFFYDTGLGYAQEMSHRPQTLYALEDSPVGLAAWMIDHDRKSYELIARVFAGQPEGLTKDDILDNATLYWVTGTAVSSARLYWESKLAFFAPKGVQLPAAVSAYPEELYTAPKSWAEKAYPKLIHYNRPPKGGHFAAWEQPASFTEELRVSFRSLRGA